MEAQQGLVADERLLGNDSGATGQVQQLTVGGSLCFSGTGGIVLCDDVSIGDDLSFSSEGAVIDWDSSDLTLTHSTNLLSLLGGSLYVEAANSATTAPIIAENATDNANVMALRVEGDRATPADNDAAFMSMFLSNDAEEATQVGRTRWIATDVSDGEEDAELHWSVMTAGTLTDELSLVGAALYPTADDGLALGGGANGFADLFFAAGGTIEFNSATDSTFTCASGVCSIEGTNLLDTTTGQPIDADLTAIAALTTTSFGRSLLELADEDALEALPDTLPNLTNIQSLADARTDAGFDVLWGWDDSGSSYKNFALADLTDEGSPATGDYVLIYGAEGDVRRTDWSNLPGAGSLPGDPGFDAVLLWDETTDDQAEWAARLPGANGGRGPGEFFWHTGSSCPSYALTLNGATDLSQATYSDLWSEVSGDAASAGMATDGEYEDNGDGTFDLMNLTGTYGYIAGNGTYGTPVESLAPDIDGSITGLKALAPGFSGAISDGGASAGNRPTAGANTVQDWDFAASDDEDTYSDSTNEISVPAIPMTPCVVF